METGRWISYTAAVIKGSRLRPHYNLRQGEHTHTPPFIHPHTGRRTPSARVVQYSPMNWYRVIQGLHVWFTCECGSTQRTATGQRSTSRKLSRWWKEVDNDDINVDKATAEPICNGYFLSASASTHIFLMIPTIIFIILTTIIIITTRMTTIIITMTRSIIITNHHVIITNNLIKFCFVLIISNMFIFIIKKAIQGSAQIENSSVTVATRVSLVVNPS